MPTTYQADDRVVLPLTFPDGTSAELVYPPELEIAEFGLSPYTSGTLHGRSTERGRGDFVGRDFMIRHGDLEEVLDRFTGSRPPRLVAEYEGVDDRTVGLWDVRSEPVEHLHYLGFQFGRWAVLVYDYRGAGSMTDAERASWAASFSGRETDDGFIVLEGSGPLRLARAGRHAGPEIDIASPDWERGLSLYPGTCTPHRDQTQLVDGKLVDWSGLWSAGSADWCVSDSMRAHAAGSRDFVGVLIRELEVRNMAIASG